MSSPGANETTRDVSSSSSSVNVGDVIILSGLKKSTSLNGKAGVVKGIRKDGRFSIRLIGDEGKVVAARPSNVSAAPKETSGGEETHPRFVTCPLCKTRLLAKNESECMDHMKSCPAFAAMYGDGDVSLEKQCDGVVEGIPGSR